MRFKIVVDKPALKFLRKQGSDQQARILKAIQRLPDIGDIKPMAGHTDLYRLRVGDFRILYSIENNVLIVRILNIGNRGDIYK